MRENAARLAEVAGTRAGTVNARPGNLPAYVRAKQAKGKIYYYFATGQPGPDGKDVLVRLPDKHSPDFAKAVADATLARWQRTPQRFTPAEVIAHDAEGDFLYFAQCGNAVKIGRAGDVAARMAGIQTNNPQIVDCVCTLTGRGHEEKHWHAMFADQRIRGEWYEWTPKVAEAIEAARRGKKPWKPA